MRLGGCIGCPKLFPLRSTKWTCEDQVLHFWTSPKPQKNLQISLKFIKTNKKYGIKCKRCEKKLKILHKKEKKNRPSKILLSWQQQATSIGYQIHCCQILYFRKSLRVWWCSLSYFKSQEYSNSVWVLWARGPPAPQAEQGSANSLVFEEGLSEKSN